MAHRNREFVDYSQRKTFPADPPQDLQKGQLQLGFRKSASSIKILSCSVNGGLTRTPKHQISDFSLEFCPATISGAAYFGGVTLLPGRFFGCAFVEG